MSQYKLVRFNLNGKDVEKMVDVRASLTDMLRNDYHMTSVKKGCEVGECGACNVIIDGEAFNSCIYLAVWADGKHIRTLESLMGPDGELRDIQPAFIEETAVQCGFCTPGFIMTAVEILETNRLYTDDELRKLLSGHLCRCTGYRPILDAAQHMASLPPATVNAPAVLQKLELLAQENSALAAETNYKRPSSLRELLQLRADHPQAQIVAGCTDVGLWVTKHHRRFDMVLDVTAAQELKCIEHADGQLRIGAAVTLEEAFAALKAQWPQLHKFAARFAGLPVRNSGTLGGNVANGSPIGDSMPLLMALNAKVVLASIHGERSLPLEALYTGYRQNVMAKDELVTRIDIPLP